MVSTETLGGPYLVDWYQHGPYVVSLLSYEVPNLSLHVLCASYMVPIWSCVVWPIPGRYLFST
jgi:hypothetical protein